MYCMYTSVAPIQETHRHTMKYVGSSGWVLLSGAASTPTWPGRKSYKLALNSKGSRVMKLLLRGITGIMTLEKLQAERSL